MADTNETLSQEQLPQAPAADAADVADVPAPVDAVPEVVKKANKGRKPSAAEPAPKPQPKAKKEDPNAPIRVQVVKNFFHDGKRFRVKGEQITLTPRQFKRAGKAVKKL